MREVAPTLGAHTADQGDARGCGCCWGHSARGRVPRRRCRAASEGEDVPTQRADSELCDAAADGRARLHRLAHLPHAANVPRREEEPEAPSGRARVLYCDAPLTLNCSPSRRPRCCYPSRLCRQRQGVPRVRATVSETSIVITTLAIVNAIQTPASTSVSL